MEKVDYRSLYALQDRVLEITARADTSFYLTGGTCLNRFYLQKRFSDDLDFFTNEPALFRDDLRWLCKALENSGISVSICVDTRDFVRVTAGARLQLDLVNDRVPRYGRTELDSHGYRIDNLLNILANKITAIIGRDEPKDVFDIYVGARYMPFCWPTILQAADDKAEVDREVLEYRLKSFPLDLLDSLTVTDERFLKELKEDYSRLVQQIIEANENTLAR